MNEPTGFVVAGEKRIPIALTMGFAIALGSLSHSLSVRMIYPLSRSFVRSHRTEYTPAFLILIQPNSTLIM